VLHFALESKFFKMSKNKIAVIAVMSVLVGCSSTAELSEGHALNNRSHKLVKCVNNSDKCILLAIDVCSKEGGFYNSTRGHSRHEDSLVSGNSFSGGKFGVAELFEMEFTCGPNQQNVPPIFPLIGENLREKKRQIMDSWINIPFDFKF
jgi:hypothetical protein